jgi:hypothetical protein
MGENFIQGVIMNIDIKLIVVAIVALIITIKVFSGAKPLPVIIGFCGLFTMILIVTNTVIAKF